MWTDSVCHLSYESFASGIKWALADDVSVDLRVVVAVAVK